MILALLYPMHVFDAVGEAQFLGGEGNGVEAEGGDGRGW